MPEPKPLIGRKLAGLDSAWMGDQGPPILLVSGPPIASAVFRHVQRRLAPRESAAVELINPERPGDAEELAKRLAQLSREVGAAALFLHGLATPLSRYLPPDLPARVILSGGPIERLDPLTESLSSLPLPALSRLCASRLAGRWLWSSLGLRRAVSNPYVMDRDTVALLTAACLGSPERARATALWLRSLSPALRQPPAQGGAPAYIWGEMDAIYPIKQVKNLNPGDLVEIPGARWLYPEERPWALADALLRILGRGGAPGLERGTT